MQSSWFNTFNVLLHCTPLLCIHMLLVTEKHIKISHKQYLIYFYYQMPVSQLAVFSLLRIVVSICVSTLDLYSPQSWGHMGMI